MTVSSISNKKDLLKELEDFRERYTHFPFEAILKQDILRRQQTYSFLYVRRVKNISLYCSLAKSSEDGHIFETDSE